MVFLVVILKHAHAYPSGAPTCNPKALDNIKSGMGQPPWWLTSDSGGDKTGGFVMRASVDTYEPNSGTVSITLSAPSGGSFSGYLLRASTSDGTPAGAFEAVATSCTSQPCFRRAPYKPGVANPAPCDSTSPDAVITHTNSRLNVFQGQATFTWRPPAQNRGDIKFEAVVVAGSATNWFVLDDVTVEAANVVTSTTTGTDTSPTTTTAQPTPSPVPAPPQDASCEASKLYAGLARWSKLYSATSDDVVVAAGQRVLLDTSLREPASPLRTLTIEAGGELVISDELDLSIQCDFILVKGSLRIGTELCPHKHKLVITLSDAFERPVSDFLTDSFGTKVIGVANGGDLFINGAVRGPTWTHLAASVSKGDSEIEFTDDVSWQPGDEIAIASTNGWNRHDKSVIKEVLSPRRVRLKMPLKYPHWSTAGVVPELAEVGLLTRSVRIEGDGVDFRRPESQMRSCCSHLFKPNGELHRSGFGGNVRILRGGSARARGVELYRMGQQGHRGRYPWHWHIAGHQRGGAYITHSSVHASNQRCVVLHRTNGVLVQSNVAFDVQSHCFFTEDGTEMDNTFDSNLGMYVRPPPDASSEALAASQVELSDATPTIFWTVNTHNRWTNNAAAGSHAFGFWYALPSVVLYGGVSAEERRDWHAALHPSIVSHGSDTPVPESVSLPILSPRAGEVRAGYNVNNTVHGARLRGINFDDGPSNNATTCPLLEIDYKKGGLHTPQTSRDECSGKEGQTKPRNGPKYVPRLNGDPLAITGENIIDNPIVWDCDIGIWLVSSGHRIMSPRVADCRLGIKANSQETTTVIGGVVIGQTEREPKRNRPSKIVGIESYDQPGQHTVDGVLFMNFQTDEDGGAAALGIQANPQFNMPWSDWNVRNVRLINADPFFHHMPSKEEANKYDDHRYFVGVHHVIPDSDGSLTGICGAFVVSPQAFASGTGGCTVKKHVPGVGGYAVCEPKHGRAWIILQTTSFDSQGAAEVDEQFIGGTLTRLDTRTSVEAVISKNLQGRFTLPLYTTTVFRPEGARMPDSFRLRVPNGMRTGEWLRLALPFPRGAPFRIKRRNQVGDLANSWECKAQNKGDHGRRCTTIEGLKEVDDPQYLDAHSYYYDNKHELLVLHIGGSRDSDRTRHVYADSTFNVGNLEIFIEAECETFGSCNLPTESLPADYNGPSQRAEINGYCVRPDAQRPWTAVRQVPNANDEIVFRDGEFAKNTLLSGECPRSWSATSGIEHAEDNMHDQWLDLGANAPFAPMIGVTLGTNGTLCVSARMPDAVSSMQVAVQETVGNRRSVPIAMNRGSFGAFTDDLTNLDAWETDASSRPGTEYATVTATGGSVLFALAAKPKWDVIHATASITSNLGLTVGKLYRVVVWAKHNLPETAEVLRVRSGKQFARFAALPPDLAFRRMTALLVAGGPELSLRWHNGAELEKYAGIDKGLVNVDRITVTPLDDAPDFSSSSLVEQGSEENLIGHGSRGFENADDLFWRSDKCCGPWPSAGVFSKIICHDGAARTGQCAWHIQSDQRRPVRQPGLRSKPIAVVPGGRYLFNFAMRIESLTLDEDEPSIGTCKEDERAGKLIRAVIEEKHSGRWIADLKPCSIGSWGEFQKSFKVPIDVDSVIIEFSTNQHMAHDFNIQIDDVELERKSEQDLRLVESDANTPEVLILGNWSSGRTGAGSAVLCPSTHPDLVMCYCEAARGIGLCSGAEFRDYDGACYAFGATTDHNVYGTTTEGEVRAVARCRSAQGNPTEYKDVKSEHLETWKDSVETNEDLEVLCPADTHAVACLCVSWGGHCSLQNNRVQFHADKSGCFLDDAWNTRLQVRCAPGNANGGTVISVEDELPLAGSFVVVDHSSTAGVQAAGWTSRDDFQKTRCSWGDGWPPPRNVLDAADLTSCLDACMHTRRQLETDLDLVVCSPSECDSLCRTAFSVSPMTAEGSMPICGAHKAEISNLPAWLLPIRNSGGVQHTSEDGMTTRYNSLCTGAQSTDMTISRDKVDVTRPVELRWSVSNGEERTQELHSLTPTTKRASWRVTSGTPGYFWEVVADTERGAGAKMLSVHGTRGNIPRREQRRWPQIHTLPTSHWNQIALERIWYDDNPQPLPSESFEAVELEIRANDLMYWPGNDAGVAVDKSTLDLWVALTDENNRTYTDTFVPVTPRHADPFPITNQAWSRVRIPLEDLLLTEPAARESLLSAPSQFIARVELYAARRCGTGGTDRLCDMRDPYELAASPSTIKGRDYVNIAYFARDIRFISRDKSPIIPPPSAGAPLPPPQSPSPPPPPPPFRPTNPCSLDPCAGTGSTCVQNGDSFFCASGAPQCKNAPNPCENGGACNDVNPTATDPRWSFTCKCLDGFFGDRCETRDACSAKPCRNGGTCTDVATSRDGYVCACAEGFQGVTCAEKVDPCMGGPQCQNGGQCQPPLSSGTVPWCQCAPGWAGELCEREVDKHDCPRSSIALPHALALGDSASIRYGATDSHFCLSLIFDHSRWLGLGFAMGDSLFEGTDLGSMGPADFLVAQKNAPSHSGGAPAVLQDRHLPKETVGKPLRDNSASGGSDDWSIIEYRSGVNLGAALTYAPIRNYHGGTKRSLMATQLDLSKEVNAHERAAIAEEANDAAAAAAATEEDAETAEGEDDGASLLSPTDPNSKLVQIYVTRLRRTDDVLAGLDSDLSVAGAGGSEGTVSALWAQGKATCHVDSACEPTYHGARGRVELELAPMSRLISFSDCYQSGIDVGVTKVKVGSVGSARHAGSSVIVAIEAPKLAACAQTNGADGLYLCSMCTEDQVAENVALRKEVGAAVERLQSRWWMEGAVPSSLSEVLGDGRVLTSYNISWKAGDVASKEIDVDISAEMHGKALALVLVPLDMTTTHWDEQLVSVIFVNGAHTSDDKGKGTTSTTTTEGEAVTTATTSSTTTTEGEAATTTTSSTTTEGEAATTTTSSTTTKADTTTTSPVVPDMEILVRLTLDESEQASDVNKAALVSAAEALAEKAGVMTEVDLTFSSKQSLILHGASRAVLASRVDKLPLPLSIAIGVSTESISDIKVEEMGNARMRRDLLRLESALLTFRLDSGSDGSTADALSKRVADRVNDGTVGRLIAREIDLPVTSGDSGSKATPADVEAVLTLKLRDAYSAEVIQSAEDRIKNEIEAAAGVAVKSTTVYVKKPSVQTDKQQHTAPAVSVSVSGEDGKSSANPGSTMTVYAGVGAAIIIALSLACFCFVRRRRINNASNGGSNLSPSQINASPSAPPWEIAPLTPRAETSSSITGIPKLERRPSGPVAMVGNLVRQFSGDQAGCWSRGNPARGDQYVTTDVQSFSPYDPDNNL
ncbi:G8 domain-containing protein [Pseudoscourfieldia marina]